MLRTGEDNAILTRAIADLYHYCYRKKVLKTPESLRASQQQMLMFGRRQSPSELYKTDLKESLEGGIARVDSRFKQVASRNIRPFSIIFQLNSYHNELQHLKITHFDSWLYSTLQSEYLLNFKFQNGDSQYYFVSQCYPELTELLNCIRQHMPAANIERIGKKAYRESCEPFQKNYWSEVENNKEHEWDREPIHAKYYEEINDPIILSRFKAELQYTQKQNGLTLLDVGGGKGRLAEKLLVYAQQAGVKIHYLLLEPDEYQCAEAMKRLEQLDAKYEAKKLFTYSLINSTLEEFNDYEYSSQIDIIISSGGPLNRQVVSMDVAQQNLRKIYELLAVGGKLIATGYSALLVTAKTFAKYGFEIESKVDRSFTRNEYPYVSCYECRKPADSKVEEKLKLYDMNK